MAPTSTYKTFLMHGTGSGTVTWSKLVDIKEFPDLGGTPEMIDVTTLSDKMMRYVLGVQSNEGMTFTANYDKTDYTALQALAGKQEKYAVWFGGTESGGTLTPSGSEGKFSFDGELSVFVAGAGVNAARDMSITIAPSTEIVFE